MNKKMRSIIIIAALAVILVIGVVAQQKSGDTAIDPVCGMTVVKATAKATYEYKGMKYYFCNPGCKESFSKDPEKYILAAEPKQKAEDKAIDPVCGMTVVKATAKATYEYKGTTYYFCNPGCKDAFAKEPEKYLKAPAKGEEKAAPMGMMHGGMGQGMRGGMGMGMACGPNCPLHGADVEMVLEKTKDGVTLKVTSKNAETVKAIQEHMTEHVAMMKKMKEEAGKAPEEACCPNCATKKDVIK